MPVAPDAVTDKTLARLAIDFHDRHRQTYGHASPDEAVLCVNLRLAAVGHQAGLELSRRPDPSAAPRTAAAREAYFRETGLVRCDVVPREALPLGTRRVGPLIIEAVDTTIVVPPGWYCRVDEGGFIRLTQTPPEASR